MNVAVIIASGTGSRMLQDIPKQFINVYDKPVIVYTLEAFQKHPKIDAIELVCLEGWHDLVWAYAKQFNIDKLKWIISGGKTGQESIRNGLFNLENELKPNDIVIIHDGIRPLVSQEIISDVIIKCQKYGNGVTSVPFNDQIFVSEDGETTSKYIPRDTVKKVTTPQAYTFGKIDEIYHKAFEQNLGLQNATYANTLMTEFGETLHLAAGSEKNLKLTTKDDLELFKVYLKMDKDDWLK